MNITFVAPGSMAPSAVAAHEPFGGRQLGRVDFTGDYSAVVDFTDDIEQANVMVSQLRGSNLHMPVIDVDLPIIARPSSTFGHYHLAIDKIMPWGDVVRLLNVLAEVGIVEDGYRNASIARGYTAVRLPWIKKEVAP